MTHLAVTSNGGEMGLRIKSPIREYLFYANIYGILAGLVTAYLVHDLSVHTSTIYVFFDLVALAISFYGFIYNLRQLFLLLAHGSRMGRNGF